MKKKLILTLIAAAALALNTFAQGPSIQWQKTMGGSSNFGDGANSIHQTSDGGYIVAGSSTSSDGDVTGHHGSFGVSDYWVVKLDATGSITWQKTLGGSGHDYASSIQQTSDGGYVVAGNSFSSDGDVTGNHGSGDYWVVKLDANGSITWQKSLGGSGNDIANSIQQTSDGGYIVAGISSSTNGDVTGNHGSNDYWVVKLNVSGSITWQKTLGGSGSDFAFSIQQTSDGGYVVAGGSNSINGNVTGYHGRFDSWVVKLDVSGSITWQKTLGGSGTEDARSIQQTDDGGYIVAGNSSSSNGDVTVNHGGQDCWVVKLNGSGSITWQKTLGGSETDNAYSIQQTSDGSYIFAGTSYSSNGDVTGHHGTGSADCWVVKLDASGSFTWWQKSLGGSKNDNAYSIQQTSDGGYIVAGNSSSTDGDVTGNHGGGDYWVVKLGVLCFESSASSTPVTTVGGNNGTATVIQSGGASPFTYLWSNGQVTQTATGLTAGTYSVTVNDANSCTNTSMVTVIQPTCNLSAFVSTTPVNSGGSATATLSGGTAPFNYLWNNSQVTQTITGLSAGAYSVTVTDAIACSATATGVINQFSVVRTVSNDPLGGSQYSTLQAAYDASSAGDTLLVEGTNIPYVMAKWAKSLVVIGAGVKTNKQGFRKTFIYTDFFQASAGGSKCYGIQFGSVNVAGHINGLLFEDCSTGSLGLGYDNAPYSISNVTLKNCVIEFLGSTNSSNLSNILITNCVINGPISLASTNDSSLNAMIDHCVFLNNYDFVLHTIDLIKNSIIKNCVFFNNSPYSANAYYSIENCEFSNNICREYGTLPPPVGNNSGSGNLTPTDPMFVNVPFNTAYDPTSSTFNFHLQPGSPGIGAANDGTDIGVHGGVGETFTEEGEPKVTPIVRVVGIQNSIVAPSGTINVQIQAGKPNQ